MTRLIAFGCSFTYGQALEDCHVPPNSPGPKPSKFAWPQLLADSLGIECVNLGESSFGNLAILDRILNYRFEKDDIVCVMWSFKNRMMFYDPAGEHEHKGLWSKDWVKEQNMYDMVMKNYVYMHHGDCYLKTLGLRYCLMDPDHYMYHPRDKFLPSWFKKIDFVDIDFRKIESIPPLGLDDRHPGPVFHRKVAEALYSKLQN